jgi:general nucleoside transport system permease protein
MDPLFGVLDVALLASTIRLVSPILLASLGSILSERAGIFNVGLEGLMLVAAFCAVAGTYWTGSPWAGLAFAVLASVLLSLVYAVVVVDLGGDAIVAGLALNLLALGLTTYLIRPVFGVQGSFYDPSMPSLPDVRIPGIEDIPVLGVLVSGYSPLVYLAFALAFVFQVGLFRHPWGIHLRAVGEAPAAAASVGIAVRRTRMLALLGTGVLCGLAGAQLSISLVTQFVVGMTAGRGFIALVAVMFGRAHPMGVLGASLLFGFMYALTLRLQGGAVPPQFIAMLPYLVTIVVLVLYALRRRAAASAARTAMEEVGTEATLGQAQ